MVQLLPIIFFPGFLQFLLGFSKVPVFLCHSVPTHRHDKFYKSHYNIKLIQFDHVLVGRQLLTFRKNTTPPPPRIQRTMTNECTTELLKKKVILSFKMSGITQQWSVTSRKPKIIYYIPVKTFLTYILHSMDLLG